MGYTVYIIENSKGERYIGQTEDVRLRLELHNYNKVFSTKNRGPWEIIYVETFSDRSGAMKREKKLKSYKGGNSLKKLLK